MHERFVGVVKLRGPARGRLLQRAASQGLEPNPRAPNGQRKWSSVVALPAGLNSTRQEGGSDTGACCCRQHDKEAPTPVVSTTPAPGCEQRRLRTGGRH